MRGFERNKIGPVDGSDHVGGNYAAALNLEANLPIYCLMIQEQTLFYF